MTIVSERCRIIRLLIMKSSLKSATAFILLVFAIVSYPLLSYAKQTIAIIGGGASGIFTAYLLNQKYPGKYHLDIYEKGRTTGGNVSSYKVKFGGKSYVLDVGAQNFSSKVDPGYYQLIKELGLIDKVRSYPVGITVWEASNKQHLFWLPPSVSGFARYTVSDWERLAQFAKFIYSAYKLNTKTPVDWDITLGKWLDSLWLTKDFKNNVVRNFLYSFLYLPKEQMEKTSAVYATTYFVRALVGTGKDDSGQAFAAPAMTTRIPLIKVTNSSIGLKGILDKALHSSGANVHVSSPVSAVQPQKSGVDLVVNGKTVHADYAVLALNPFVAKTLLKDSKILPSALKKLIADLGAYYDNGGLKIFIQTQKACWMPTDKNYREFFNVVADTPKNTMRLSLDFGPVNPPYEGKKPIPAFKTLGSPEIELGECPTVVFTKRHTLPIPLPAFMKKRDEIQQWQGKNHLFYAGSWTNWYDSQESALQSAKTVVGKLQGSGQIQPAPLLTSKDKKAFVQHVSAWLSMAIKQASHFPKIQKDMTDTLNKIKALPRDNRQHH